MKISPIPAILLMLSLLPVAGCNRSEGKAVESGHGEEQRKIVVTSPEVKDVITTEQYVCQIHSRRHIEVRALEGGYLEEFRSRKARP